LKCLGERTRDYHFVRARLERTVCFTVCERRCRRYCDWWLNKDKKLPPLGYGRDYLRLANLETATGLDAPVVFLLGVDSLLAEHRADLATDAARAGSNPMPESSTWR
jgi:hypothetical protein